MARQLDYYFSLISPWAYIGHRVFMDLTGRHKVAIKYKPVALTKVFSATGGLPLGQRHPARQRYRILELQRWRAKRGLNFDLHPPFWPFEVEFADRFVIAATMQGIDPGAFLGRAFAAVWERRLNLADEATLRALAEESGLPVAELLAAAAHQASAAVYARNVTDAIAVDAFGSPCFVLDGEVFWGQDRLELLDDALTSGRRPYRSDV
jgi:2-hydroxychromene-2-carboxylate isomerase